MKTRISHALARLFSPADTNVSRRDFLKAAAAAPVFPMAGDAFPKELLKEAPVPTHSAAKFRMFQEVAAKQQGPVFLSGTAMCLSTSTSYSVVPKSKFFERET